MVLLALVIPSAVAQTPTADNRDTLIGDLDSDTQPDRGDTIRYDVQVSNPTLAAALMLMFSSTLDANQSFVAGSLNVSPLARDDAYDTPGNTLLEVGVTPGGFPSRKIDPGAANDSVLDNDQEFLGDTFTLTTIVNGASANGGVVNLNADGTFTYLPPLGFSGTDTFTYTIRDDGTDATPGNADDLLNTGTVTITVGTKVWYVNNSGGAGDGRSTTPFNSLASVTGATGGDAAGDIIYLHAGAGAYTGGMVLLNNQTFHGQNVALVVGGNTIQAAGAAPTVANAGGHAVTLAQGNTVQGMSLGSTNAGSFSLFGNAFGSLTVSSCSINNGSGGAVSLTTGTPNVTLSSLSSAGSTGTAAVNLDACGGSFSASGGTITAGSGPGWRINGGTVASTYSGSISQANNAALVSVSGGHATGAVLFQTGALGATNGTGLQFDNADSTAGYTFNGTVTLNGGDAGIDIANGSDGNFTFANAPITNPTGIAFDVDGGNGTISHAGAISKTSTGRLIDITARTGGSVSMSGNLSSTNPGTTGINVSSCTGTSSVLFSGGAKTLATGGSGAVLIDANSSGTTVDFTGGGLDIDVTGVSPIGGFRANSTGAVTIQGSNNTINSGSAPCLQISNAPTGAAGISLVHCIGTSAGQVLSLLNNPGTKTIGLISTSSGTSQAVFALNAGTINLGNSTTVSTLTTTTGAGLFIGGTTLNLVGTSTGAGLDITTTAGGTGVSVQSGTTSITGGGLDIDTDDVTDGPGLVATSGGTFSLTGSNNTVTSGSGIAINITTAIGASGVTFQSVNRNGGSTNAISLANTGSGQFTVTGVGTTQGSGGTIENISGADAVRLNNTDGRITFRNMIFEDVSASTDASDALNTRSGVDAIHGQSVDGGLTLDNVVVRRISDNAVNGTLFSDGLSATNWNGLEIRSCLFENTNRFHVASRGDAENEGIVRIVGLTGTVVIDASTLQNGAEGLDAVTTASGLLDLTVQRSQFLSINKQFSGGSPLNAVGQHGIDVIVTGASNAILRIGDPAESNAALGNSFRNCMVASIRIAHNLPTDTGTIQAVVSRNQFIVDDHLTDNQGPGSYAFDFPQGGVVLGGRGGVIEGIVSHNTFDQVMHASGGVGQLTLMSEDGVDAEYIVRSNTFRGAWDFITQITARNNTSAAILWRDNIVPFMNLTGAELANTDIAGLPSQPLPYETFFVDVKQSGRLDLTIQNENIPDHDRPGNLFRDESFFIGAPALGVDGGTINLRMDGNKATNGYGFQAAGPGTISLFRNGSAAGTVAGVLQANGNTGGGVNPNTTPPTVTVVSGTVALTNTPPVLPSISIPILAGQGGVRSANAVDAFAPDRLSHEILVPMSATARTRWSAALVEPRPEALDAIAIEMADLPGDRLAEHSPGVIRIDLDAGGRGWFVDPTPMDDSEFPDALSATRLHTRPDLAPAGRMDLLSVILHEMGHALGLQDEYSGASRDDLMHGRLSVGERRLPAREAEAGIGKDMAD